MRGMRGSASYTLESPCRGCVPASVPFVTHRPRSPLESKPSNNTSFLLMTVKSEGYRQPYHQSPQTLLARRVHAVEEHFALEDGETRGVKCTPGGIAVGDFVKKRIKRNRIRTVVAIVARGCIPGEIVLALTSFAPISHLLRKPCTYRSSQKLSRAARRIRPSEAMNQAAE